MVGNFFGRKWSTTGLTPSVTGPLIKGASRKHMATSILLSNIATHTHAYHLITDSLFESDISLDMGK